MVRSILNFVVAVRAWGSLAGIMVVSPVFRLSGLPDMVISVLPSMM